MRTIFRRLERLEAQVLAANDSHSALIQFVDVDMRVTSTLLIEAGKSLWTHFEARTEDSSGASRPE